MKGGEQVSDIGQRMVEYRAKHNISQEEFAIKAHVCLMTVNHVENGKREPTKLTRAKIEQIIKEDEQNVSQG